MKKLVLLSILCAGVLTLQACDNKEKPTPKVEEEKAATLGFFDDLQKALPNTYRTAPDPAGDLLRNMKRQ